jgi:ribosomal protein S12
VTAAAALAALEQADAEYRTQRREARARHEALADAEVDEARVNRDRLAYQARQEGNSVRKIAHVGLHTKSTNTAYEAIERGEALIREHGTIEITEETAAEAAEAQVSGEYTLDGDTLTIIDGDESARFEIVRTDAGQVKSLVPVGRADEESPVTLALFGLDPAPYRAAMEHIEQYDEKVAA